MKHFLFSVLFLFLCFNIAEAQTNVNIAGPENVLVVYNSNSSVSDSVMQYYVNARNIPSVNIVPLDELVSKDITVGGVTHRVKIAQETDLIQDSVNHVINTWYATEHAWKYFYQYVAAPIMSYVTSNNLTNIRYIVLCKGVPFKIQAAIWNGSPLCNVTTSSLLCLLNTNNYEDFLHDVYIDYRSRAINVNQYNYYPITGLSNPYYNADPNFTMNYRFLPGKYTRSWNGHTVKLDYLVSHLDGISYEIVEGMIDRSIDADKSGTGMWILDDDPTIGFGHWMFDDTKSILESKGFNVTHNSSNLWITSNPDNVMGYFSWGTHAEDGNCNFQDSAWIKDSLQFTFSNGSIFNALESFNGYSLTTLKWRFNEQTDCSGHTMGLSTQFTEIGGTGMVAHAQEPYFSPLGVVNTKNTYPAYAMGYSMVDAIYQGIYYLAWQNVVVGDPLTTIAWGKQETTSNLTWSGDNLVTGEITIPLEKILTIEDNSHIELRHDGFIPCETGYGRMYIGENVTFETDSWDRSLFFSYDNENARLVWAPHPTISSPAYHIYRKLNTGSWNFITTTSANEFIDDQVEIVCPECPVTATVYYYVAVEHQQSEQLLASNTVSAEVFFARLTKNTSKNNLPFNYSLFQNHPNPFNPTTTIKYSLKDDGLVSLKIYNILGSEIAELVNEQKSAGEYSTSFDFSNLSSGTYFYVLRVNDFVDVKKMVLLK